MLSLAKSVAQASSRLGCQFNRSSSYFFSSATKKPSSSNQSPFGKASSKKSKAPSGPTQTPAKPAEKKHNITTTPTTDHKKPSASAPHRVEEKRDVQESTPKVDLVSKFRRDRIDWVISKLDHKQYSELCFPIDFSGTITRQPEKSMISPYPLKKLIKYETIMSLFKTFFDCCAENSLELYKDQFEPYFYDRVQAYLTAFQEKNYRLNLRRSPKLRKETVDLFNVKMILGMGVSGNRKENDSIENYSVHEAVFRDCPITTILVNNRSKEELVGRLKYQLDFNVKSPLYFELIEKDKPVLAYNTENGQFWHHMKIEGDVVEIPETMLVKFIGSKGELSDIDLTQCRDLTANIHWNIIDFDNFLNGNPLLEQGLKW